MTPWTPKAPSDVVTYQVDWPEQLGITQAPLSVVPTASGVTIDSYRQVGTTTYVTLSGGADQTVATITFDIDFQSIDGNPGQSFSRDLSLFIGDVIEQQTQSTVTKRAVIEIAFEEIGLSDYEFNVTPEEYRSAMRKLDTLMREWQSPGIGIYLGYNSPAIVGQGDLDDVSGLPDEALNIVALKLALRIAPPIGKSMSPESQKALSEGWRALQATYAKRPQMRLPVLTIRGAGNRWWGAGYPFIG